MNIYALIKKLAGRSDTFPECRTMSDYAIARGALQRSLEEHKGAHFMEALEALKLIYSGEWPQPPLRDLIAKLEEVQDG